jgi:hypothetical protein
MIDLEKTSFVPIEELDDDMLEAVTGGYSAGDVVNVNTQKVKYCEKCGRLIMNYQATITGVRGELDGKTVYWVTRNCCGYRTCVIETAIVK